MADVLSKAQRSYNMSMVKGKNTRPEFKLRKLLFGNGIRGYKIHYNILGKPDLVFTKYKIAVFIDGCFWHKCPLCFKNPETNREFWLEKINSNVLRDKGITKKLKSEGWKVIRIWEHDIKGKNINKCLKRIVLALQPRGFKK